MIANASRALSVAALLWLGLWSSGCATTFTTLDIDKRVVRLQVTSDTPEAVVLLNGQTVGQTPTEVVVKFHKKAELIRSGKYRAGWAVLGAGLAMVATGVAMTGGGVDLARTGELDDDDGMVGGGVTLAVFGVGLGLTGLASMGVGSVALATSESSRERTVVQPATAVLEVKLPGRKRRRVRFSMSPAWPPPRLEQTSRVHVFDRRRAVRGCTLRVLPEDGVEVMLAGPQLSGTAETPLDVPCQVRRLTPLVGLYDRAGRPLFKTRYALQLGKKIRWREGKLEVPLTLKKGDREVQRVLVLEPRKAWEGPQVTSAVGMEKAEPTVQYGRHEQGADAAPPKPPPGAPASP